MSMDLHKSNILNDFLTHGRSSELAESADWKIDMIDDLLPESVTQSSIR
jgi:hypothetical protein